MIDMASVAPSRFDVAGKISHPGTPDWLYGKALELLFASGNVVEGAYSAPLSGCGMKVP